MNECDGAARASETCSVQAGSRRDGREVVIRFDLECELDVDDARATPPRRREPDTVHGSGGLGMVLVERLATGYRVFRRPAGRTVRVVLAFRTGRGCGQTRSGARKRRYRARPAPPRERGAGPAVTAPRARSVELGARAGAAGAT
ncbi:hypothetical protein ABZ920_13560 [Streptomyces sp. NPDC046831]|uniref:hypothetical protein n=1 Tax=Streptomyces sp. NPDC046831 TaxID=3154805 RepID=UPI0033EDB61E